MKNINEFDSTYQNWNIINLETTKFYRVPIPCEPYFMRVSLSNTINSIDYFYTS